MLPEVGTGVAQAIAELLVTGRWRQLDRLRGDAERTSAFEAVPGIGHALALRIHDLLHIDTLEELERAARNGQLETISGVGPRRAAGIRAALDDVLSRRRRWQGHVQDAGRGTEPPVELLLYIDRLYRNKAAAGVLPTPGVVQRVTAHRRPNADDSVPLPVMHMTKGGWHFTALCLPRCARRRRPARRTGSRSISTTPCNASISGPSSPKRTARSSASASCADASRNAACTTRAESSSPISSTSNGRRAPTRSGERPG